MGKDTLRGAVIGCGYFAQNHLHGWSEIDGARIVGVCDIDGGRARRTGERFGVGAVYTDAAAMLEETAPDFVDIVTQAPTHRPLIELAAGLGIHAICQKPFAPDMAAAREAVAACRDAGTLLMVHENFRWQAPMRAVKNTLLSGAVGTPHFCRIVFRNDHDIFTNQPYLAEDSRFIIYDLGIHLLDLARFLMGEVSEIYCRTMRVNPAIGGEDCATMVLELASGGTCVVEASYASHLERDLFPQTLVHVEGQRGSVTLGADYALSVVGPEGTMQSSAPPRTYAWSRYPGEAIQDGVVEIQRHWIECLGSGADPETSGLDNLRTLELVFGSYDSAGTGLPYRSEAFLASPRSGSPSSPAAIA